jgi:hypothetical protein
MLIFIIIGFVLVVGTLVTLYITGVFDSKSSSSSKPSTSGTGSGSASGSGSGINPITENFVTGAWFNAYGPPWDKMTQPMDIILIASYCPDPYCYLHPCSSPYTLFPNKTNTAAISLLQNLVSESKKKGTYVLLSIGGSAFGTEEWKNLLRNYMIQPTGPIQTQPSVPCQCPLDSYWLDNNGTCAGTIFDIYYTDNGANKNCSGYPGNSHKCCCPTGFTVNTVGGVNQCVPEPTTPNSGPTSPQVICDIPGQPANMTDLNVCINSAKNSKEISICKAKFSDSVIAYADMLIQLGADGIDFDFESYDIQGVMAAALIPFSRDLKAEMNKRGKSIILTLTVLAGDNRLLGYGPFYDVIKTNNSPFDYVVPMLYNGGQYSYFNYKSGATLPQTQFSWNGLLDNWANTYMIKGQGNTKLLPAFICYRDGYSQGKPMEQDAFECSDLQKYINEYIITPASSAVVPSGALFFYYVEDGDNYNTSKINNNIKNANNYFKNRTSITC